MARVLLNRNYNTPYGRFKRSIDGEPTFIPDVVIERMKLLATRRIKALEAKGVKVDKAPNTGLPSDAEVVDEDYQSPAQIHEANGGLEENDIGMSGAEQEAAIHEEVERRLAEIAADKAKAEGTDETDGGATGDGEAAPELLSSKVEDIVVKIPDLGFEQLEELLAHEKASTNPRKTLVVELEAAIEDFE